ncbi:MAG: endonuclease III [Candidatus Omnitrophica bacterium]|nr:endonuclease III [Candidatus Omnitrophota bacterium]MCM8809348.1 endonuclease III [Candidatus Omnitrophota bacterium]MCM8810306.1 endonuclease III [Candidatus Omnitrophota bacterium]MCM8833263.1 endonuclease III [Candidatus Omnitrophota bacterium]
MEKIKEICLTLKKMYPESKTELKFKTPFQLLIATVLSAQTTDERVNKVTANLFKKYKTPEDFGNADVKEIMKIIKSVNFYRNKAKNIKRLSQIIVEKFNSKIPDRLEELIKLPGVARKTANVVLSQAFRKAEGIVVDTHVKRVAYRLGLTRNTNPEKIEKDLMKILPKTEWIDLPFRLILFGRNICKSKNPDCNNCPLYNLCLTKGKTK